MATYYWVGGSGTWDAATTTNWAASSGGSGNAGVPTSADNVIFDANSGASPTVTISSAVCSACTIGAPTSGTLTLAFGTSSLTMAGNLSITTSISVTGTGTINLSAAGATFAGNGNTFYNVNFTSTAITACTISGSNTFNNLSFAARSTAGFGSVNLTAGTTSTVSGTLTLGSGTTGIARLCVRSTLIGSPATLSVAVLSAITDIDFRDVVASGVSAPWSGTRIGNCLGNSNITFTAARTVYWVSAASGNWTSAAWSTTSGNTGGTTTAFPLAQDTIVIDNAGLTAGNSITLNASYQIGTLDFSSRSNAATFATGGSAPAIYGDYVLSSAITVSGTGTITFAKQNSTATITSAGKTFTQPVQFQAPNGTVRINGDLTLGPTLITALVAGTLDLTNNGAGNYTFSVGFFSSNVSSARSITFGTGQINVTGNGSTVWALNTATNFSYTGTPTVNLTYAGATSTRTFNHGGTAGGTEANAVNLNVTAGTDSFNFSNTSHVKSVNFTGFSGTLTNVFFNIYGDITISSGMTLAAGPNQVNFGATSGTQRITSNGKTLDFPINFEGVGGTYALQDNLTIGSTRAVALNNGTLDLTGNSGNWTLTSGFFNSHSTTARSVTFGTGKIVVTANGGTVFSTRNITNFSCTGSKRVELTYAGSTGTRIVRSGDLGGTATADNTVDIFITAGSDTVDFFTNATTTAVRSLDTTGFSGTISTNAFRLFGSLTLSATTVFTGTANAISFISTSAGNTITTNGATVDRALTFDGIGGSWAFQDALTQGSTRAFTITNGTVELKAGATSTVGAFATSGTNQKFLQSTLAGSQATLSQASGTVSASFLTIRDINATGGATWQAFTTNNNVDAGNNLGWDFLVQIGRYIYTRRKNKRILP